MSKLISFAYFIVFATAFLFAINKSFGQVSNDHIKIKKILENVNTFNETFVKIIGKVSNIRQQTVRRGPMNMTEFTVTDNTGSIEVFGLEFTLQSNDSVSVIGQFLKEREIGQFLVGKNEVDASVGQVTVLEGWYLKQQKEQQILQSQPESDEDNYVPVMQVETAESKIITYATIIGLVLTTISLIPLFLRKRRFNIDLKMTSPYPPNIIKSESPPEKYLTVKLILYNLQSLHPEINSFIACKIGKVNLNPSKILSHDTTELKFPLRIETETSLTLYFNYDNCIQHFSTSEKFTVKIKDEFCKKTFCGKFNFNFVIPSENEDKTNQS